MFGMPKRELDPRYSHELRNEVGETGSRAISYKSKTDLGCAVLKLGRKRGM
jgi:hypothetical protein